MESKQKATDSTNADDRPRRSFSIEELRRRLGSAPPKEGEAKPDAPKRPRIVRRWSLALA